MIYLQLLFVMMMFRNSIKDEMIFLLSMTKIQPDDVLESLYKLRIHEADQLKTASEVYDMEIHKKIL